MCLLVWNSRGLGNPCIERELGDYIWAKDPSIVFLAKTWVDDARLEWSLRNFDFKNRWTSPSSNREGGLVQLWKDSICLSVEDWSKYCIDALIEKNTPQEWHFIGFYGEPATSKRHEAWAKLRTLNDQPHISWLCAGDFNEIARQDEKLGGAIRGHHQMQLFQDVLDECEFIDLGFIGPKFTWSKHCNNGHSIWERLDRGSAIDSWFLRYPGTWVYHLPCLSSNHCPLLINPTS